VVAVLSNRAADHYGEHRMTQESWAWSVEQQIPSQHGAGRPVIDRVVEHLEKHSWGEHEVFGVRLALEEAIVNAIKHGNQWDESKQVHVVARGSSERLWAQIRDEGPGFQPEEVPDCTAEENLDRPCGRGIMLMRNFMSRVEYNASGNCVEMEKVLGNCC
jgi:serine/threonine-protein kinase RsbW